ncbi:MAG: hypothetical protein ACKOB3_03005, partial [Holophagaceae bacterium]
ARGFQPSFARDSLLAKQITHKIILQTPAKPCPAAHRGRNRKTGIPDDRAIHRTSPPWEARDAVGGREGY